MTKNRKTERTLKEKLMGSRYQPTKEDLHQDMRLPITLDRLCHKPLKSNKSQRKNQRIRCWSGREDSNLRPLPPEGSALPD